MTIDSILAEAAAVLDADRRRVNGDSTVTAREYALSAYRTLGIALMFFGAPPTRDAVVASLARLIGCLESLDSQPTPHRVAGHRADPA